MVANNEQKSEGQMSEKQGILPINFQSESKQSGDHFEDVVMSELVTNGYVFIKKNVYIKEAGIEIDFVADGHYIEAKGGYDGNKKRPGAKRTDSVKKAIANGTLLKAVKPDAHYMVYFSAKPVPESSSDVMIKVALENKIIDEVIYLEPLNHTLDTLLGNGAWLE